MRRHCARKFPVPTGRYGKGPRGRHPSGPARANAVDEGVPRRAGRRGDSQDRAERRRRLLPARLVVYFVLALCLFARESYEELLRVLTSGIPSNRALARVNRSSLCRALKGAQDPTSP
ncbi:transposase domain-containing protein [Streptomyces sp. NPDC057101]|uniref:transposase domain-containing protein n=1 Tax=Streptomyces sp. NPDC057101 TaxID=3346020 RepID=UPI003639747C